MTANGEMGNPNAQKIWDGMSEAFSQAPFSKDRRRKEKGEVAISSSKKPTESEEDRPKAPEANQNQKSSKKSEREEGRPDQEPEAQVESRKRRSVSETSEEILERDLLEHFRHGLPRSSESESDSADDFVV